MSDTKKKLILKNLKDHNTVWHPESTLVFKSQKDRLVIGRYVDGQLISLDDTALELCEKFGFVPDDSLLEDDPGDMGEPEPSEENGTEEDAEEEEVPPPTPVTKAKPATGGKAKPAPVQPPEEVEVPLPPPVVKQTKAVATGKQTPKVEQSTAQSTVQLDTMEIGELARCILDKSGEQILMLLATQQAALDEAHQKITELEEQLAVSQKKFAAMKSLFA